MINLQLILWIFGQIRGQQTDQEKCPSPLLRNENAILSGRHHQCQHSSARELQI